MARTMEQIVKDQIGALIIDNAVKQAKIEELLERLAQVEQKDG